MRQGGGQPVRRVLGLDDQVGHGQGIAPEGFFQNVGIGTAAPAPGVGKSGVLTARQIVPVRVFRHQRSDVDFSGKRRKGRMVTGSFGQIRGFDQTVDRPEIFRARLNGEGQDEKTQQGNEAVGEPHAVLL